MATIGPKIAVIDGENDGALYGNDVRLLFRMLQPVLQANVISAALANPPGAPANGDTYIVAAAPTGAWVGHVNNIAYWTTADPAVPAGKWEFYSPKVGWFAFNQSTSNFLFYNGAWVGLTISLAADVQYMTTFALNVCKAVYVDVTGGSGTVLMTNYGTAAPGFTASVKTSINNNGDVKRLRGTTNGLANDAAFIVDGQATPNSIGFPSLSRLGWRIAAVGLNNTRYWMAFTNGTTTLPWPRADVPPVGLPCICFRFSPNAGDATWKIYVQNGLGASQVINTGIAPDTNVHYFEFRNNLTSVTCYIDGVLVATVNGAAMPNMTVGSSFDTCVSVDDMGAAVAVSFDFVALNIYLR